MAASSIQNLIKVLRGSEYPRGQRYTTYTRQIDNEYVILKYGADCFIASNTSFRYSSISGKVSESSSKDTECIRKNKYSIYKMKLCNLYIEMPTFYGIYKRMFYNKDERLYKWSKNGYNYYLSWNIILDENKKALLIIVLDEHGNFSLIVNKKCISRDDFMSKYIMSTFIPAAIEIGYNVHFTDTNSYTQTCKERYRVGKSLDIKLNDKLKRFFDYGEVI